MEPDFVNKICLIAEEFLTSNMHFRDRDFHLFGVCLVGPTDKPRIKPTDEPFWEVTFEEKFKDGRVRDPGIKVVRISDRTGEIKLVPLL